MTTFTAQTFTIPKLKGISEKNIDEHIKLYQGYVKNANSIFEQVETLKKDSEKNAYVLSELMRRFSFEYNGMRNHELYFAQFAGGAKQINEGGELYKMIEAEWGSFESWLTSFKAMALTRGIGWAMLWYDPKRKGLLMSWVDEQHLGQLNGCVAILGLDMWEHSFVYDYQPSGKKNYVEDFFSNLNWSVVEKNLADAKQSNR